MPSKLSPVARILRLLKLEKAEISAVYFYAILNGLIQLSLPIGVQAIVGFVLGAAMRASLVVLITLVVIGVLTAGIMQVNQMKIIEKIQQKIFVRYAFAFAEHIPTMDLNRNDKIYMPELINRFFDIPVLQKSLSKILLDIPTASVQIVFGLVLLSFYHQAFILFGIVLLLMLWLILKYSGKLGLQTSIDTSTYKYKVAAWLEESGRLLRSIKLVNQSEYHLHKTDVHVGDYLSARTKHFKVLLFQYNVLIVFKTLITAAMLIVGTILLVNQQMNIGQFIAAEIVILLVINSVEKLIINLSSVYDTLTAVDKLSNLTETAVEKNGALQLSSVHRGLQLEMKDLCFGYNNGAHVLKNVNISILPGEKVCIIGDDGAGKSTLLRLMACAYGGYSGALLINEIPLANYNPSSVRNGIALLTNGQDIFDGTLWENLTLGKPEVKLDEVMKMVTATGLNDFISSIGNGFDTMLYAAGKCLPTKVIHKILLVRVLLAAPNLLLIEEPWLSTEKQRERLRKIISHLPNTTVVMISNDKNFDKYATKLISIANGYVSTHETGF